MKRALRVGGYGELNVYFQTDLKSDGMDGAPANVTLLGYCSLPWSNITSQTNRGFYVLDGCNVLGASLPGGAAQGYNLGATAAHEVGHWLGLLHTFEGRSCEAGSFGDYGELMVPLCDGSVCIVGGVY